MRFVTYNYPGAGKITVNIDGVTVGVIDTYSSPASRNVLTTIPAVAIGAGTHVLQLLVATKNSSSSGYGANLSAITLVDHSLNTQTW
jgi:hypothetical protein